MAIPSLEEWLANVYRMKRDCVAEIAAAEADGDLKLARSFQIKLRELNAMIIKIGGDPNA